MNAAASQLDPLSRPLSEAVPPLENGDCLSRTEFERRYRAMPNVKKAELVEGKVYMPSPVKVYHSEPHIDLSLWLGMYRANTPGTKAGDNGTLRMDDANEPQPDAYLRILEASGGQARVDSEGYIEGTPELVVEIAASSASHDLREKKAAYQRNGVREYIVWCVYDQRIDWFIRRGEQFDALGAGAGIFKSEVFPGLWLDAHAMIGGDMTRVMNALREGLSSAEHAQFVGRLGAAGSPSSF
jgi:Uma2 family endonuclease